MVAAASAGRLGPKDPSSYAVPGKRNQVQKMLWVNTNLFLFLNR